MNRVFLGFLVLMLIVFAGVYLSRNSIQRGLSRLTPSTTSTPLPSPMSPEPSDTEAPDTHVSTPVPAGDVLPATGI